MHMQDLRLVSTPEKHHLPLFNIQQLQTNNTTMVS